MDDLFDHPTSNPAKDRILTLLEGTDRKGMKDLIAYLLGSDFFTAPASRKYHSAFPGGLALHSLQVYELFDDKINSYNLNILTVPTIIAGLLHDVCKIGLYRVDEEKITPPQEKYLKDLAKGRYGWYEVQGLTKAWATNLIEWYLKGQKGEPRGDEPIKATAYVHKDEFPIGHGEKSIIVLQKYIPLTDLEIMFIRWHMGPWAQGEGYNEAVKQCPAIIALFCADMESSHLVEKRSE